MSKKSRTWLTRDRGKALVLDLSFLSFFLSIFIVGTTKSNQLPVFAINNQLPVSTIISGQPEQNTRMNGNSQRKQGKIEGIWGITN